MPSPSSSSSASPAKTIYDPPLAKVQQAYKEARLAVKNLMLHKEMERRQLLLSQQRKRFTAGWLVGIGLLACSRSALETLLRESGLQDAWEDRRVRQEADAEEEEEQAKTVASTKATVQDKEEEQQKQSAAESPQPSLFFREALAAAAARPQPIRSPHNTQLLQNFTHEMNLRDRGHNTVLLGACHRQGGPLGATSVNSNNNSRDDPVPQDAATLSALGVPSSPGSSDYIYLPQ